MAFFAKRTQWSTDWWVTPAELLRNPTALSFLAAYGRLKHRPEQFPNAFRDQGQILSLPMFAEITRQQLEEVIDLVRKF